MESEPLFLLASPQIRWHYSRLATTPRSLPLVQAGAEVIIPAGGLPMLLLVREQGFNVQGAMVLNGIATAVVAAEAALKLFRLTGVTASRLGTFAKAPPEAIQEFQANL